MNAKHCVQAGANWDVNRYHALKRDIRYVWQCTMFMSLKVGLFTGVGSEHACFLVNKQAIFGTK